MTELATRTITVKAPSTALFAAAEVHATENGEDYRIVGAWPAFDYTSGEMVPLPEVAVPCKLTPLDKRIKVAWVYEQSSLGIVWTEPALTQEGKGRGWRR